MVESVVQAHAEIVVGSDENNLIRILLVDDEVDLLKVSKQCLEMQGSFQVDTASSVYEAMEKMKNQTFDVLVADYQMPGKDGLQFLRELRQKGDSTPFIVFTGRGREEVAIKALNLGASQYLSKTGDPEAVYCELAHSIQQAAKRSRDTIQLKKAERRLFDEHARLLNIFLASPSAIVVIDLNGKITECNEQAQKLFGYLSKDEIIGKNSFSLIAEKDRERAVKNAGRTLKQGLLKNIRYFILNRDGHERLALVSTSVVQEPSGNPCGFVIVAEDITETQRTADELQRFSTAVRESIDGVVISDLEGKIVELNDAALRLFGADKKTDLIGKNSIDLLPEEKEKLAENMKEVMAEGYAKNKEINVTRKNGTRILVEIATTIIKDGEGNPVGFLGIVRDTTERKKVEDSLRESEKKYHSLHSSMSEGVALHEITFDGLGKAVDYIILDVNPAFESIIGIKKEKAVGSKASDLYKTGKPPYLEIYAEVAASGKPTSFETYFPPMRKHFNISVFSPARGKFATVFYDITERKKADLELQESEKKYRELADQLPIIVYEIDDKGRLTFVNDKGFEMTGYSREDIERGLNIIQMVASEDREKAKARIQKTLNGEKIGYNEYMVIRKDGSRFPAIVRGDAIVREGKIVGLRSIVVDISERKKAEESLRESEEKFRNLAESSPNMIFINRKGRVIYANTKAKQVMGYTKEAFYAPDFDFLSLIAPESRSIVKSSFSKHQDGKEVDSYGYELVTKMGRKFHGLINTKLVTYDGERAILGVVTDVSELSDAEKFAKESQQKFAALFSGNPEATVYLDTSMHVLDINPRFTCLFGYSPKEARGKHIDDLVVPENLLEEGRRLGKEAAQGYVYQDTVRKTKGGLLIPVSVSAAPVYVQSELKGYVWLYKDISQQKSAEIKLAMTNEKLRVISGLTRHDVRNKLTIIISNMYLDEKKLKDQPEIVESLRMVESACDAIVRIFDFARDYERLGVEELTFIDVENSFQKAAALFLNIGGENIANECHGLAVLADSLLAQLFYNLIDNSLKHGDHVTRMKISHEESENELRLIYEDDGVGIPEETKPKLFSEGYTTGKGTGYGLYLIKKMMEVYGWAIQETGTPGKGVQFTITIPKKNKNGRENYQIAQSVS